MKSNIIFLLTIALLAAACNGSENALSPSDLERDWFVLEDSSDPLDHERYLIYKEYGIPIYYNDTIGSAMMTDVWNNKFTHYEKLQVFYVPGSQTPITNNAHYFLVEDRDDILPVVEYIRDNVLTEIPEEMYIPSILLVDSLKTPISGDISHKGLNTVIVSKVRRFKNYNDADKKKYKAAILRSTVAGSLLGLEVDWLEKNFYSISRKLYTTNEIYGRVYYQVLINGTTYQDWGFLPRPANTNIPQTYIDLTEYIEAIFTYTAVEFEALHGGYVYVMQKYNVMKSKLEEMGFTFE